MGKPEHPNPVKLFTGVIFNPAVETNEIVQVLEERIGEIDTRSASFSFDYTDYYREEMGGNLKRKFFSFAKLVDPGLLPQKKHLTNELESEIADRLASPVLRPVNIDPGYIGLSKLVLVTTKNYSHRNYLGDGIYGEVTLQYKRGEFEPLPWTYPDYRSTEYREYFSRLRGVYKDQFDRLGN